MCRRHEATRSATRMETTPIQLSGGSEEGANIDSDTRGGTRLLLCLPIPNLQRKDKF